jgi:hypothetical protein
MNTYGRFPLEIVRGKGVWLTDRDGRRYLDAVAGIASWRRIPHPLLWMAEARWRGAGADAAWPLLAGLDCLVLSLSGKSLPFAVAHSLSRLTGLEFLELSRVGAAPAVLADTLVIPYNNAEALERVLARGDVAAFIVEPVMENIGICMPKAGYLEAVPTLRGFPNGGGSVPVDPALRDAIEDYLNADHLGRPFLDWRPDIGPYLFPSHYTGGALSRRTEVRHPRRRVKARGPQHGRMRRPSPLQPLLLDSPIHPACVAVAGTRRACLAPTLKSG